MNHRMMAIVVVVVMVSGAIVQAAPIQSSGPPEPEALLLKGHEPAVVVSSPYVAEASTHELFTFNPAAPSRAPVRLLPYARLAPKAQRIQREVDSVVSVLADEQRYEPLDFSLRIATDAFPRRHVALQPTLSTYTVTTTADSGPGSLRQCLLDATPGTTCGFDPQAFPPGTPATIALLSPLPAIITDSLMIDGSDAGVVLDGSGLSAGDGLAILGADGVIVRGLQILNFPRLGIALAYGASNVIIGGDRSVGAAPLGQGNLISGNGAVGVLLQGVGTTGNQVLGNYIGSDATGMAALGNDGGVLISFGATDNVVGGNTANARNIISGNSDVGVKIQNDGTSGNQVLGNYIGTDASGVGALGNRIGVAILLGATDNVIGGEETGAHNVISGNDTAGIRIQGTGTSANQVLGNYIGTDAAGAALLGNTHGVLIMSGATDNIIGGDSAGARNIISGNDVVGIQIQETGTTGNQVLGNYIGTDATGTAALGNGAGVVIVSGPTDNVVGGDTDDSRNIISGNSNAGVQLQNDGTSGNRVLGNYIDTDASGTVALGNSNGIRIWYGASDNLVGGDTAGARNVVSGNKVAGITIDGAGTTGNHLMGNYIGTDAGGAAALGNKDGVLISSGAANNFVGGDTTGARNVISGNDVGIQIQLTGTTGNQVRGNYIGTDAAGAAPLGNVRGILIGWGATDNVIGGDTAGARNIISGNAKLGIQIQESGTTGNRVLGNYIGIDATGTARLQNAGGIAIMSGATDNVIGGDTTGARNVVSGNNLAGIQLQSQGTTRNHVLGNYIGTDATGTSTLGNGGGVVIAFGATDNVIGGDTADARNIISGNSDVGVQLQDNGTSDNQVLGNYIGTDAAGTAALGNGAGVVIVFGPTDNVVGGYTTDARNVISGNDVVGIQLRSTGTTGNYVMGNYIGTNATGIAALGNGTGVILMDSATDNVIGGDTTGARNVISGNDDVGIWFQDSGSTGNRVLGNYVGTDVTGMVALSNQCGILIGFEATGNIIGGDTDGARNVISGNDNVGIQIQNGGTTGNQVLGNYIGINATGVGSLGNDNGVIIMVGAADNIIGGNTAGARNIISANGSGNGGFAVWIQNDGTTGNQVAGNYIGMNVMGTAVLANNGGVFIGFGATENIVGGSTPGAGNLISGNGDGVWLQGTRTTGNEVIGNDIVSNTLEGVYLGDGANANTIGVSNTIAYNGSAGVVVDGVTTRGNTVTRNSIHSNGDLPIKFINTPIPISAPVLTTTLCSGTALLPVTGSACPNCVIELYANPDEPPSGAMFLAETTANASGDFTATVTCALAYPYLSATATGLDSTTSEFYPGSTATSWAMVFLPLVMRQTVTSEQQGIYGRVTYNGTGVAGIHLDLRFYDGAGWSTWGTAVTAANGDYQFIGVPGLSTGQAYYVRYLNGDNGGNADNPNYLFSWYAPSITSYTSGDWISGGDFDIANVPLVSPSNDASVTLPTNFLWTRRSITDDSYKFVLYYPAQSQAATTSLLGYVQDITLNGLPSGWPSGGVYDWWVQVHHGDGTENFGEAYGANGVTIYAATQAVSSLTLSPGNGVEMYERGLQVLLEQSP